MRVLTIEPGKKPVVKTINKGLESLQKEVGGYIQAVYPFEDKVALICNEDGKLNGLPFNRTLRDSSDNVYDIITGTFLVVGLDEENFCSLTDELSEKYLEHFKFAETFIPTENGLVVMKIIS